LGNGFFEVESIASFYESDNTADGLDGTLEGRKEAITLYSLYRTNLGPAKITPGIRGRPRFTAGCNQKQPRQENCRAQVRKVSGISQRYRAVTAA